MTTSHPASRHPASRIDALLSEAPGELRLETELLIARAMGWTRARVLAFGEHEINGELLCELQKQLTRLASGEPFAYITGTREFFGLDFKVTPDVLIPRPETELLVEIALATSPQRASVVDLGTGSGAIAISLAHKRPDLSVTATDFSADALAIAQHNAERLDAQLKFVQSNWFEALKGKFDTIISNPPYIRTKDPHLVAISHEPQQALVAGQSGLDDIITIVSQARGYLKTNGNLLIEHGYDQATEVAELFEHHGFTQIQTHLDLAGHSRVTTGRLCEKGGNTIE